MKTIYMFILAICFVSCTNTEKDRKQRIALAKEILENNKNDISDLATKQIKDPLLRAHAEFIKANGCKCDCIIDSLAPKFADKHSLSELEDIEKGAVSSLNEITILVTENQKIFENCLSFNQK